MVSGNGKTTNLRCKALQRRLAMNETIAVFLDPLSCTTTANLFLIDPKRSQVGHLAQWP